MSLSEKVRIPTVAAILLGMQLLLVPAMADCASVPATCPPGKIADVRKCKCVSAEEVTPKDPLNCAVVLFCPLGMVEDARECKCVAVEEQ